MGRATSEDLVKKLAYVASSACLAVSVIFVLVAVAPWFYFHGYLTGYYSPLDYRMWYGMTGKPVVMPHTDYIRHATAAFAALSILLLAVSVASLALAGRRLLLAAGAAYGASAGLVVLHGLLYGYVHRAAGYDVGMFSPVLVDEVVVRTLAGVVSYEGATIEQTLVYRLAFGTPLVQVVLALAVVSSAISVLLLLLRFEMERLAKTLPGAGKSLMLRFAHHSMPLLLVPLVMLASVFTYYPSSLVVRPQPPPATLEAPPYAYTCVALTRTSRGALAYTDFETYPVPGWTSYGGVWEPSAEGGFKGNALRGRDNNGGVGGVSSQYYWTTRIDGYSSLWVSVRARAETTDGYKGIGLLNADRTRLYEISVQSTATIYKWDGTWRLLGSVSVSSYSATRWYTLVLYYVDRGTSVDFTLWVYDDTGTLVATLTASDTGATRFRPAYAGVTIDAGTTVWFRFDDFIVSTTDPRSVLFSGFTTGMRVEVWDNLGNLVNSTIAPTASFSLGVTRDIVVGTGVNGRIVVGYPDGFPCLGYAVPISDAILGGDGYGLATRPVSVSLGANRTSAGVTIHIPSSATLSASARFLRLAASQVLYARLMLDAPPAPAALDLDLWLEGATRSTNITIRGGVPVSSATSEVQLNLGPNNPLALAGRFTAAGQSVTIRLRLQLCSAPGGRGACVYYPLAVALAGAP